MTSNSKTEPGQKIMVYTGPGASNSWVWLADFLEKFRFYQTRFCPEFKDIVALSKGEVLIIPGGDTFRIAEYFGEEGLSTIAERIRCGAGYIGICAGAYLPLKSSIPPLSSFNLIDARIANISSNIPENIADAERYSVPYGCSYVYHPVRGPLRLNGERELVAPLYGGPILSSNNGVRRRLSIEGIVQGAELLVPEELCERTIKDGAACIEGGQGKGKVLVIAPHLEHPDYPMANEYFRDLLHEFETEESDSFESMVGNARLKDLKSVLADLRVVATALDSFSCKIGVKYWEGEKLLFFIEAIRKRLAKCIANEDRKPIGISDEIISNLQYALSNLKEIRREYIDKEQMDKTVSGLSNGASLFLNAYFSMLRNDVK